MRKENKSGKRILVVAAHPDDEVLGCGASIARHVASGDCVEVLILGEGIASRKGVGNKKRKIQLLRNEARKANKLLGVNKLTILRFPDNSFDSIPLLEIIHSIESVVDKYRPHIIYTHHHGDVNIDHQRVSCAMQAICRPTKDSYIEEVFAFEVPSSSEWNFRNDSVFSPNIFADIQHYIEMKVNALESYNSELRAFPHPRSLEYIRALALVRGAQSGMISAEAFCLVYSRKFNNHENNTAG